MHARVHRHDFALAARKADTELAHVARIGAQEEVRIGKYVIVVGAAHALDVELHARLMLRLFRDDVDDAADGVRAVFRARCALDDLDALDVLRAEAHDLIRRARIFRKISQDRLSVHEDQCVARLCATD